jgi:hypothetical protein
MVLIFCYSVDFEFLVAFFRGAQREFGSPVLATAMPLYFGPQEPSILWTIHRGSKIGSEPAQLAFRIRNRKRPGSFRGRTSPAESGVIVRK